MDSVEGGSIPFVEQQSNILKPQGHSMPSRTPELDKSIQQLFETFDLGNFTQQTNSFSDKQVVSWGTHVFSNDIGVDGLDIIAPEGEEFVMQGQILDEGALQVSEDVNDLAQQLLQLGAEDIEIQNFEEAFDVNMVFDSTRGHVCTDWAILQIDQEGIQLGSILDLSDRMQAEEKIDGFYNRSSNTIMLQGDRNEQTVHLLKNQFGQNIRIVFASKQMWSVFTEKLEKSVTEVKTQLSLAKEEQEAPEKSLSDKIVVGKTGHMARQTKKSGDIRKKTEGESGVASDIRHRQVAKFLLEREMVMESQRKRRQQQADAKVRDIEHREIERQEQKREIVKESIQKQEKTKK